MYRVVLLLISSFVIGGLSFGCSAPTASSDGGDESSAGEREDAGPSDGRPDLRADGGPGERGVVVATVNLRCLLDQWEERRALLVDQIAELDPDVLAFQEACREPEGRDNLSELVAGLEAATGRSYSVVRAETHFAWDAYHEGIALASALPVEHSEIVDLPVGLFPRRAVVLRVTTSGGALLASGTHLSFGWERAKVRAEQLATLRGRLAELRGAEEPALIAGDLNERPRGRAIVETIADGYADLWLEAHPGAAGPTFPAVKPRSRIDYLLFTQPERAISGGRFLDRSEGGSFPSDHLGVWAELQ